MAFVRQISFIVPAARSYELQPGHNLLKALVYGQKTVAQNTEGFHQSGVWTYRTPEGNIKVTAFTQWYDLRDLEAFANVKMIRDLESDLSQMTTPLIEIYEVIG